MKVLKGHSPLFFIILVAVMLSLLFYFRPTNLDFEVSECKEEFDPYEEEIEIISQQWVNDRLEVLVRRVTANCCSEKRGDYSVREGDLTLKLIEYGPMCKCICPFDLKYTISSLEKKDYVISFEMIDKMSRG